MSIKVRATQTGFYDGVRRREGDVFFLKAGSKPSVKWMEVLEGGDAEGKRKAPRKAKEVEQAPEAEQVETPAEDDVKQNDEDLA